MKLISVILIFAIQAISLSREQSDLKLPYVIKTEVETKHFNGKSLWGYINGGADLYLEYGFDNLTLHTFNFNGEQIKIELYKMSCKEAAFGIFSVSHNKCNDSTLPTQFYCINNYHIQIAKGKYYISIINETGKKEALDYCMEIAKEIIGQIPGAELEIPEHFKKIYLQTGNSNLKLFSGELGLQNINTTLNPRIQLNGKFSAYTLRFDIRDLKLELTYLKFDKKSGLMLFLKNNNLKLNEVNLINIENNSVRVYSKKINNKELVLFASADTTADLVQIFGDFFNK